MGIALVRGRTLLPSDDERTPRVAVINETLARRYWPGENPIGTRLGLGVEALRFDRPDRPPRLDFVDAAREIVGVVRDVRHDGLTDGPRAEIFLPYRQRPARAMSLVVRTGGDPLALVPAVRRELRAVAPDQPITSVSTMAARVAETLGAPRARMALLLLFACLAVMLAGVGTYGVVAYGVAQRRGELGVRLALGAPQGELARLVMRQGIALTVAGLALGVGVALAAGRVLRGLLFGVSPTDLPTFVIVPCVVGAIALLATWLPARRATRIDPAATLRSS
jgi:putative ABC transport system permease protein